MTPRAVRARRRTLWGSTREEDIPLRLCSIIQGQLSNRAVYMPAAPHSIPHLHRLRVNSRAIFSNHTLPLHVHQHTNKPVNRLLAVYLFIFKTAHLHLPCRCVWPTGFDLQQSVLLISPCKQLMHSVANGHRGRSYLASSNFASVVFPGQLGQTLKENQRVKRVLLMDNWGCKTMQIDVLSCFFAAFSFLFFFSRKNLSELQWQQQMHCKTFG